MISHRFSRLGKLVWRCQICLYLLLALLSGALLPIQASLNAQLARSLGSVPLAADLSYLVGALALVAVLLTDRLERPNWSGLVSSPPWSWAGGVLGAWYISSSTYFTYTLGATLTLGLVVGGQVMMGIITDHFGWLNIPQHRLTPHRRFAVGLLAVALFFLVQPRYSPMEILIVLLTASSAGGFLSIGAAANARLRRSLRSPVAAATVNFMVGFSTLTLLLVLGVLGSVDLSRLALVPWWAFLGGLLGAVFVTLNTLVVPQLGLTTTTLAVVCSQMTMSLLVDQWGWFGLTPHPINASRAIASS